MKNFTMATCVLLLAGIHFDQIKAQNVYPIFSGELLFQSGTIEKGDEDVNTNLRFTMWFHTGHYIHIDFGNNIGFYSGMAIRNVGFTTEKDSIKIKYRSYSLGIPLALKLGSFRDDFYIFGGAEYEWMFHFKQKTFINDEKTKYTDWFSNRTPSFIPSVFAGIHFPKGFHLTFKYYLDDFLNHKFKGNNDYNDYTGFTSTQLWYISLSFQMRYSKIMSPGSRASLTASSNDRL